MIPLPKVEQNHSLDNIKTKGRTEKTANGSSDRKSFGQD